MNDIFEKCILSDNVPNMLLYGQSYLYDKIIERFYQLKNIKDVKINLYNISYIIHNNRNFNLSPSSKKYDFFLNTFSNSWWFNVNVIKKK